MKKSILFLMAGAVLTFTSCKKENYDDKYQAKGDYGNSSIVTSNTVTLNNWSSDYDDGINYEFSSSISWPLLTQAIVDNGAIMAYLKEGSDYIALPFGYSEDTYFSENWNFSFSSGNAKIYVVGFDDSGSPSTSDYNGSVVKLVAISAEIKALYPEVDFNNYTQVASVFGLK
jgi:hypothetical protein